MIGSKSTATPAAACVLVAALAASSCGGTERKDAAGAAGLQWSIMPESLGVPAAHGSFAPQITSSSSSLLMSWIERDGDRSSLRFVERNAEGWSPARTAASGSNWFASWADTPSVLRMTNGTLVANWFVNTQPEIEAYDFYVAHSTDDGRTWTPAMKPHRDRTRTQHGFASLFEMQDKSLGMVWLDGRDMENNTTDPEGGVMTLRFTSFDPSWKQSEDVAVNARVCECCQTAAVVTKRGVLAAFRDRSENEIRDIAVSRLERGYWTSPEVVHADNWTVDVCPVNGPALSANGQRVAVAWFTGKDNTGHVFAAFSEDGGTRWTAPVRVDEAQSLGYADVELLDDGSAAVSWVEFSDQRRRFKVRRVHASGATSAPIDVAGRESGRVSGYPRMARFGDELVFAWTESGADEGNEEAGQHVKGAVARLPRTTAP